MTNDGFSQNLPLSGSRPSVLSLRNGLSISVVDCRIPGVL